jgi:pimeloyl-ACP methyl ester carboxylesterase
MARRHTLGVDNSTNVRFVERFLRGLFTLLGRVAPGLAAAAAERLFFTPPRPRRSRGEATMRTAERLDVRVDGRRLAAWRWGRGPAILLLHGWGGRAAQLTSFVRPLVRRGFSVVTFDAPGHGRSGRGLSSAPQFARALRAVADATGGLHGVVAHSLGSAATALALRDGLRVGRAVFLAPAADPPSWVGIFARRLGIAPHVVDRMRRRSERRLRMGWEQLRIPVLAAGFDSPLLVIHDRDDAEVPLGDGATVAASWRGARLLETSGLGHNGVLRDPEVVAQAAAFLAEGEVSRCGCGALAEPDGVCESCRVERELFDRAARCATLGPATA